MKQRKQLYSQNQIASMLGIGRSTLSKWLKSNSVSPILINGQRKYYDETVIEQYKNSKKANSTITSEDFLFQDSVSKKQEEIDQLKKLLVEKEKQLQEKNKQLMKQTNELIEFGKKFAKLADQAQQLNLADKDKDKLQVLTSNSETSSKAIEVEHKHWWNRIFK